MKDIVDCCVVLTQLPPSLLKDSVRTFLDGTGYAGTYKDIDVNRLNDKDVRWIVYFSTKIGKTLIKHYRLWVFMWHIHCYCFITSSVTMFF